MPTEARVFAGGLPYNLPVKRPLSPVLKPTVRLRKDGPNLLNGQDALQCFGISLRQFFKPL